MNNSDFPLYYFLPSCCLNSVGLAVFTPAQLLLDLAAGGCCGGLLGIGKAHLIFYKYLHDNISGLP